MFDPKENSARRSSSAALRKGTLLGAVLMVLGAAGSAFAQASCPVTFAITNNATPEALQFEVTISPAAVAQGDFTNCQSVPSGITDFNTDLNTLEYGWATDSVAFAGPGDFAVCTFTSPSPSPTLAPADFNSIAVLDCTESANPVTPCGPAPTIGVTVGTCSVCGNGTVEPGEQCETTDPNCNPDCTLAGNCPDAPIAGCKVGEAGKSKLQIKSNDDDTKDSAKYQWGKGAATMTSEFADPVATAGLAYRICVYDADGLVSANEVPSQGTCDGKPCWKASGTKGFSFASKAGIDGITKIKLGSGDVGKAKVQVQLKGKGGSYFAPPLPLSEPTPPDVRVQVVVDTGAPAPACFETSFLAADKNDDAQYSAKGP